MLKFKVYIDGLNYIILKYKKILNFCVKEVIWIK